MKLPPVNNEIVKKMFPCHALNLYGKPYFGDALDLMSWVDSGKATPQGYLWCVLREEFIPKEVLQTFTTSILYSIAEAGDDTVEARDLYLKGEFTKEELQEERLDIKMRCKVLEKTCIQFRTQVKQKKTVPPVLQMKVKKYDQELKVANTIRYGTHPDLRRSSHGLAIYLCGVGESKLCMDLLKKILIDYTGDGDEAQREEDSLPTYIPGLITVVITVIALGITYWYFS